MGSPGSLRCTTSPCRGGSPRAAAGWRPTADDAERLDFLEAHLGALGQAHREGVDVRGYLHWSAFDNFEWAEGYGPKFGLIAVDRDRDFARVPKPSAYAFANVARTGRLAALRAAGTSGKATLPG
jgi:beta-glucosidase